MIEIEASRLFGSVAFFLAVLPAAAEGICTSDLISAQETCRPVDEPPASALKERWTVGEVEKVLAMLRSGMIVNADSSRRFDLPTSLTACGRGVEVADLRGLELRGDENLLDLREVIFGAVDLRGGGFFRVNLSGSVLYGANLAETRWSDVVLDGADLKCSDLSHTRFERRIAARGTIFDETRGDEIVLRDARVAEGSFNEVHWPRAQISSTRFSERSTFRGGVLAGATLEQVEFLDGKLERMNLSGVRLIGGRFRGVSFEESDLSGMFAVNVGFCDVSFARAIAAEPANFGASILSAVNVADIDPRMLGLRYVRWRGGDIEYCEHGAQGRIVANQDGELGRATALARTYSDLRNYYSGEGGNSEEARTFGALMAIEQSNVFWLRREFFSWLFLKTHEVLHAHYREPWRLVGWMLGVIFLFALVNLAWVVRDRATLVGRVGQAFHFSILGFFAFATGIVDVVSGVSHVLDPVKYSSILARVSFLLEGILGIVWLLFASAVALDNVLLP